MNPDSILPDFILITYPDGSVFNQPVIYEHTLPKCSGCGFTGHTLAQCHMKTKPRKQKDVLEPLVAGEESQQIDIPPVVVGIAEPVKETIHQVPHAGESVNRHSKASLSGQQQSNEGSKKNQGNNLGGEIKKNVSLQKQQHNPKGGGDTSAGRKGTEMHLMLLAMDLVLLRKKGNLTIPPNG